MITDDTLRIKHDGTIKLRLKNITDSKCYDSSNDNNSPIIFSHCLQSRQQRIVLPETATLAGAIMTYANTTENIIGNLVVKTKYVTTFRDRINIKAAISPAKIQNIT